MPSSSPPPPPSLLHAPASVVLSTASGLTGFTATTWDTNRIIDEINETDEENQEALLKLARGDIAIYQALTHVVQHYEEKEKDKQQYDDDYDRGHQDDEESSSKFQGNENSFGAGRVTSTPPALKQIPPPMSNSKPTIKPTPKPAPIKLDVQGLDLLNPPQVRSRPWDEADAKHDLHKTIDNHLYYQNLAARYSATRRHVGPDGWLSIWDEQERWAMQATGYWARNRLKIMERIVMAELSI